MRRLVAALTGFLAIALATLPAAPADAQQDSEAATLQYASAVRFQNRGAFDLAAEEWTTFLTKYKDDSRADRATHYLGVCQLKANKPDQAAATFARLLKDFPKSTMVEPTYLYLGVTQYTQAQSGKPELFAAAADTFQELITKYPKSNYLPQALFYRGECFYGQGKKKEAAEAYGALVKQFPDNALTMDAMYALGVAQEEMGDPGAAGRTYEAFLAKYPASSLVTEVGMRRGETLFAASQYAEAAKRFAAAAAAKGFPLADYATLRQAASLALLKQYDEAAALYASMATAYPKSQYLAAADLAGGKCYYLAGKYDQSRAMLSKVAAGSGEAAAEAAHWIARGLLKQQKAAEALAVVEKALPEGSKGPWAVQLLMDQADAAYEVPDRRGQSVALYAALAEKYPKDALAPQALYMAGFAALGQGDYQTALAHATKFLATYADNELAMDVTYVAAESQMQLGQYAEAEKLYGDLLAKYPGKADAATWQVRRGLSLQLQKKYKETVEALTPVVEKLSDPQLAAEAQFLIGASQAELGDAAAAIKSLEASLAAGPKWRQADETWLVLAHAYRQENILDKAIECARKVIADFPESRLLDRAHYRLGEYLYAKDKFKEAADEYRMVVQKWPQSEVMAASLYGLGWAELSSEDYAGAEKTLDTMIEKYPNDKLIPRARYARGMARQQLGKFAPAAEDVQALLAADPTPAERSNAAYVLGLCQVGMKKQADAVATFEKLLKDDPNYAGKDKVLYELGWAQKSTGKEDAAAATFAKIAADFPDSKLAAESLHIVGEHKYEKGDFNGAATAYYDAARTAGKTPLGEKATYKLGWSYYRQDDLKNAVATFEYQQSAWPKGPLAADAAFMVAECLFKQEMYEKALAAYDAIKIYANKDFEVLGLLHAGQAAAQLNQWDKSLELLEKCITQFPDSPHLPQALYEKGWALQNQKKMDDAIPVYEQVVAKATSQEVAARAQFMIGEIQFGKKDYRDAIKSFYRVVAGYGYPKWQADAMFEAARCFKELNLNDKAIDQFRELIEKHPDSDKVPLAKDQIKSLGG